MEASKSASSVKKDIRSTKRLLAKENIPADMRLSLSRRVKSLEEDLDVAQRRVTTKKASVRYKQVRFVESVKCTRKITKLEKQLAEVKERLENIEDSAGRKALKKEKKSLKAALESAKDDLNYITVSCFP